MNQLGLADTDHPTPLYNNNRGSLDWIESGCKSTKKLRHKNLAELSIYEAKHNDEVTFHWIPGKINKADIFTKEDNDVGHFCTIRDSILMTRENFGAQHFTNPSMTQLDPRGVLIIINSSLVAETEINTLEGKSGIRNETRIKDKYLVWFGSFDAPVVIE